MTGKLPDGRDISPDTTISCADSRCSGEMKVDGFDAQDSKIKLLCDTCFRISRVPLEVNYGRWSDIDLYGHALLFNSDDLIECDDCDIQSSLDDGIPLGVRNVYRIGLMKNHECGEIVGSEDREPTLIERILGIKWV